MSPVDQYLLGNAALYARLSLVTEVLGKFVSASPRAVGIAQLERQTARSTRELQRVCAMLCREGLLRPEPKHAQHWVLACEASLVTLEDVFRCVMAEKTARERPRVEEEHADTPRREVDLLLMQATMGIQQSVFHHLRQFSLDRLKVGAAGMLSTPRSNVWPRLSFS